MLYVLLGITIICGAARAVFSKKVGVVSKKPPDLFFSNGLIFAVIFLITFVAWLIKLTSISGFTAVWALVFAVVIFTAQFCSMRALKDGVTGVCAFIYACGFVISAFWGVLFKNEQFFWSQVTGVGLILVSFFLIMFLSKQIKRNNIADNACAYNSSAVKDAPKNKLWIVFALVSMVAAGFMGVIQRTHQTSAYKDELFAFLFISASAASGLSLLIGGILAGRKAGTEKAPSVHSAAQSDSGAARYELRLFIKAGGIFSLLTGITFGVCSILNLYLSGALPGMMFFPVYNGGVVLSGLFTGIWIFKDKISKYDIVGLILGLSGILLIALKPF